MFRKAEERDIDAIVQIYDDILTIEETGPKGIGWIRGVYPTRDTAVNSLKLGELYVLEEDGTVAASARLNRKQEEAYRAVPWLYPAEDHEVMVMHTLTVSPSMAHRGIGKRFAACYEQMARDAGCSVLRIDTNRINSRARKMYASLGYREAGIIPTVFNGIDGVDLVCLEKKL